MQFVKMHGLGNDFVIVSHDQLDNLDISSIASNISNRNTGIGCDQFIVYKVSEVLASLRGGQSPTWQSHFNDREIATDASVLAMTNANDHEIHQCQIWIYNNDGSLAGACGNATRCMMKLLYMEYGIEHVELDVLGRKLACRVLSDDKFEANMGKVSFDEAWMPESEKIWDVVRECVGRFASLRGGQSPTWQSHFNNREIATSLNAPRNDVFPVQALACADIGNRHLVLFVDEMTDDEKWILGEKMEHGGSLFTTGVNVSLARVMNGHIELKVWERQVGFTQACGSGACVTVAAAIKLGFVNDKVEVHFSSGILDISMKDGEMYMAGPATFVGRGEVI